MAEPRETTPLPRLPMRHVMPAEERRLLERCAVIAVLVLPVLVTLLLLSR